MKRPSMDAYASGILAGDRSWMARAITLVESRLPSDCDLADELMLRLAPHVGSAIRVGISGSPGVGKSTFIEALGMHVCEQQKRCAVLAVDPSSARTGGSILGDKTRMHRLSREPRAFVRPSPSGLALGGVGNRTREAMLICEAAGFDVVIVETVGVGQSEILVADLVDSFVLLMQPGAGDDLQGIKRGILEVADLLLVNKADGETLNLAREAATQLSQALRLLAPSHPKWPVHVALCSAVQDTGIEEAWSAIERHHALLCSDGSLQKKRAGQAQRWMWRLIEWRLIEQFRRDPKVQGALRTLDADLTRGACTPELAARKLMQAYSPGTGV